MGVPKKKKQNPLTVIVGHRTYLLVPFAPKEAEDHSAYGINLPVSLTMKVDMSRQPEQQGEAAIHELLHSIWEDRNLDDKEEEEKAITALSRGLAAFIRNNPGVFEMFAAAISKRKPLVLTKD